MARVRLCVCGSWFVGREGQAAHPRAPGLALCDPRWPEIGAPQPRAGDDRRAARPPLWLRRTAAKHMLRLVHRDAVRRLAAPLRRQRPRARPRRAVRLLPAEVYPRRPRPSPSPLVAGVPMASWPACARRLEPLGLRPTRSAGALRAPARRAPLCVPLLRARGDEMQTPMMVRTHKPHSFHPAALSQLSATFMNCRILRP